MASRRPSFLKRQKEQQRKARADEKREARRARQLSRTTNPDDTDAEAADTEQFPAEGTEDSAAEP